MIINLSFSIFIVIQFIHLILNVNLIIFYDVLFSLILKFLYSFKVIKFIIQFPIILILLESIFILTENV